MRISFITYTRHILSWWLKFNICVFFFLCKLVEVTHLVLHRGHFCDTETLCHLQILEWHRTDRSYTNTWRCEKIQFFFQLWNSFSFLIYSPFFLVEFGFIASFLIYNTDLSTFEFDSVQSAKKTKERMIIARTGSGFHDASVAELQ